MDVVEEEIPSTRSYFLFIVSSSQISVQYIETCFQFSSQCDCSFLISESQNLNTSKNIMGPIKRTGKRVAKVSTISNDKRPNLREESSDETFYRRKIKNIFLPLKTTYY